MSRSSKPVGEMVVKRSKHKGGRKARVASAIHSNIAELIQREVKDPRVRAAGLFTIDHVELNGDLSVAYIYTSFFGATDEAIAEAMEGLHAVSAFLRGPVGRRMGISRAPELKFVHDTSVEFRTKLAGIVAEDEARAVDWEPDDD